MIILHLLCFALLRFHYKTHSRGLGGGCLHAGYEAKKQYDEAQADLVKASSIAPEDKLVIKMLERVRAILKRQQEKEKQMWSKAFSS